MASNAEKIARAFHDEYEAFAEVHGWETQEATRTSFDDLPAENRQTMISTVQALLDRNVIAPTHPDSDQVGEAPADLIRGRIEHRLKLEREAQANYPAGSVGRTAASYRADGVRQALASAFDSTLDVYATTPEQSPGEGRGDGEFTVGACVHCRRPAAYCICDGNLGCRADGRFATLEIIDRTAPQPYPQPKETP